jgi:hypothetical protein
MHTVNFATRTQNNSSTPTDNTFVDSTSLNSFSTSPIINGLMDHGLFITINNIAATPDLIP